MAKSNTPTSSLELSSISRKLRVVEISIIAERAGYSPSHVSNVLANRRNNDKIVAMAKKMTARRK